MIVGGEAPKQEASQQVFQAQFANHLPTVKESALQPKPDEAVGIQYVLPKPNVPPGTALGRFRQPR